MKIQAKLGVMYGTSHSTWRRSGRTVNGRAKAGAFPYGSGGMLSAVRKEIPVCAERIFRLCGKKTTVVQRPFPENAADCFFPHFSSGYFLQEWFARFIPIGNQFVAVNPLVERVHLPFTDKTYNLLSERKLR